MKVQMITGHGWYHDKKGNTFTVFPYPKDDNYWRLAEQEELHITKLVRKDQCKVIEE